MKYEDIDYTDFTEENYQNEISGENYALLPQMRSSGVRFFVDENAPVVLINLHSLDGMRIADDKELIMSIVRKSIEAKSSRDHETIEWAENFTKNPKSYIGYFSNKQLASVFYDRYALWLDRAVYKDSASCFSKIVKRLMKVFR